MWLTLFVIPKFCIIELLESLVVPNLWNSWCGRFQFQARGIHYSTDRGPSLHSNEHSPHHTTHHVTDFLTMKQWTPCPIGVHPWRQFLRVSLSQVGHVSINFILFWWVDYSIYIPQFLSSSQFGDFMYAYKKYLHVWVENSRQLAGWMNMGLH